MIATLAGPDTKIAHTILAEDYDHFGCPSCRYRPDGHEEPWREEAGILTCKNETCKETFCICLKDDAEFPFLVNGVELVPQEHPWHGFPRLRHPYKKSDGLSREELERELNILRSNYEAIVSTADHLRKIHQDSQTKLCESEAELKIAQDIIGGLRGFVLVLERPSWRSHISKSRLAYALRVIIGYPA